MDIQQTDKESLATYVHRFKREANRCKFDNDATTIRIFLKGLKNVHTIATKVYEKGPQTLTEAIREVEKLQAAQQLTSSLLPMSSVNVMTTDQEKCFQCQEVGHMAHYCPHIKCYDCDNYGHVAMDCHIKFCHQACQPTAGLDTATGAGDHPPDTTVTQVTHGMNTEDLDTVTLDPNPMITATGVAATVIPVGVNPDHSIGLHTAISHKIEAPVPITTVMTHHTTDNLPVGIPSEMTADLATKPEGNTTNCPKYLHGSLKIENINKSQLTIHHLITIVQMTATGHRMMI